MASAGVLKVKPVFGKNVKLEIPAATKELERQGITLKPLGVGKDFVARYSLTKDGVSQELTGKELQKLLIKKAEFARFFGH